MPSLTPVTQDDQIVEITIDPSKLPSTAGTQIISPEGTAAPVGVPPANTPISPSIPQNIQNQNIQLSTEQKEAINRGEAVVLDPKGFPLLSNGEIQDNKPKNLGGRPCEYCKNKDSVEKKVQGFIDRCTTSEKGKTIMPFLEELCLELDIDEDTMSNWANKKTPENEAEHPWFFGAYKKLRMVQKLRLQQRTMGRYNPTGAIFLLKANHGYMESEKKILAGDRNEPLQIEIIEEAKREVEA